MRRLRRLCVPIAAVVALLAGAAPASAALRWAKAETLAPGFPGTVAIDARGDVLAVWQRVVSGNKVRTFYAWRPPRGDWTEAREIDAPRTYGLALALSPLGQATIAWNDGSGRIVSAEARPGGAFGDEQVIASGVREAIVDIEADDAGNAVAAWLFDTRTGRQNSGATIFVATRRPGGEWSEPQDVSGDVAGGGPFVATNAAGAAAVAWITVVGGKPELAYRLPAGRFGRGESTPLTGPTFPLHLALDDVGRAFLSAGANAFTNDPFRTQVATRSPLGEWGERFEFPNGGVLETMVADPKGVLTFLMTESTKGGEQSRVQYAALAPNGSVAGPVTLAEDRSSIEGAMNLRGDLLAAWHGWPGPARVEVADRLLGGVFTPPVAISQEPGFEPEVASTTPARRPSSGRPAATATRGSRSPCATTRCCRRCRSRPVWT